MALANIAKVDAVAAAAIAKINGLVFTTAAGAFLLDTYTGAAAGYSTRRLATSATNLMRIREDAGDTETDIGYDSNNELDTAAIATHCGTANGYVVTWYDQAGSNNATQSTETNQPQIYNGTAVITENGKPALDFDGINDFFETGTAFNMRGVFFVTKQNDTNNSAILGSNSTTVHLQFATNNLRLKNSSTIVHATTQTNQLLCFVQNDTTSALATNGGTATTGTIGTTAFGNFIGKYSTLTSPLDGVLQELVIYETNQSSNRTGIETNINSEYLIYQPTDAPTSGLLADYTGAAAAYSVRQLSDKAVIALRVRRDSDDEEINIGFDANGDLDSQAISDFCSTANGYVTRWWDQSTNGTHADQATDASQPQIYNGTAVITENGKPAVDFNTDVLEAVSIFSQSSAVLSFFIVFKEDDTNAANRAILLRGNVEQLTEIFASQNFAFGNTQVAGHRNPENQQVVVGTANNNQNLFAYWKNGTNNQNLSVNAGTAGSNTNSVTTTTLTDIYLGANRTVSSNPLNGQIQEFILWFSDQDTAGNRTGIESNIDTYFSIT